MKRKIVISISILLSCLIAIFVIIAYFLYPYTKLRSEINNITQGSGYYDISCFSKYKEDVEFSLKMNISGEKFGSILKGTLKMQENEAVDIEFYYDMENNKLLFNAVSLIKTMTQWIDDNMPLVNEIISCFKDVYISLEQLQSIQGDSEDETSDSNSMNMAELFSVLEKKENIKCHRIKSIEYLSDCETYYCFEIETDSDSNVWLAVPKEKRKAHELYLIIKSGKEVDLYSVSYKDEDTVFLEMPDNQLSEKQVDLITVIYVLYQKTMEQMK